MKAVNILGENVPEVAGQPLPVTELSTTISGLLLYFEMPTSGLWRDKLLAFGYFVEEPAPASSFYRRLQRASEHQRLIRARRLHSHGRGYLRMRTELRTRSSSDRTGHSLFGETQR